MDLLGGRRKVTRLAHGVPVGGELDYLDEGTLSAAFKARVFRAFAMVFISAIVA